ncbi:orc1/cdc6 family replication initiation protein [Calothrix sp. FACHB-1219]|uniref:AAA family ATPase n=1 Tax=unclassified Calothrix TaxID=2619626 RepID=UPI001681D987|nr:MULTISPECIES: AAA family ATPase [unclassified Calothrix]MBD2206885.1 orc1/cdc6 family replication initiation protein [Calothrix sp. FACHB-168]MBD2221503.1 orc1/cdc6 family replication initiation protein [Calothrix sp. FACHB-1219]
MDVSYQVLGANVPNLLGREALLTKLERQLLKTTPDHVCVVGPARYGKSVLLNHLAQKYRSGNEYYITAMYIDLRHSTPTTDEEFKQRLAKGLRITLSEINSEFADYLEPDENDSIYELLDLVFEELDSKGDRLLIILDGFDHVLQETGITRNLWDQLRNLAQHSSLRLVTGSRKHLRNLRDFMPTDSRVSDFWEIFNPTPLTVAKLDDSDWDGFLLPLNTRNIELDSSACKEVNNWTGGIPILAAALLRQLAEQTENGTNLSKIDVDAIAESMVASHHHLLEDLWEDCTDEMKGDLARSAEQDIDASSLPHERKTALEQRGLLQLAGNKLKSCCRLMKRYALLRAPSVAVLHRLFQTSENFEANIQQVLQMRLNQIQEGDSQLLELIQKAIRDISPNPMDATNWMRRVVSRSLEIIWLHELPPDRILPVGWINEWQSKTITYPHDAGRLPASIGGQCNILQLITGSRQGLDPISKYVTKPTYILVNHIREVADFGQHTTPRDKVTTGIAAAYCLSAISLCESLKNDLPT